MNSQKECNICHILQDEDNFYKRKDRNGNYTWGLSYCKLCEAERVKTYKKENPAIFRDGNNRYSRMHYHINSTRILINRKRCYYNKLSPDKQIIYKNKLSIKHPELVGQICG